MVIRGKVRSLMAHGEKMSTSGSNIGPMCHEDDENTENHLMISPNDLPNIPHLQARTKRPNLTPESPKTNLDET